MNEYAIRLEKEDNVIIARRELKKGLVIEEEGVTLLEDIRPVTRLQPGL